MNALTDYTLIVAVLISLQQGPIKEERGQGAMPYSSIEEIFLTKKWSFVGT